MDIIERVKAILLTPKSEWLVIERESGETILQCVATRVPRDNQGETAFSSRLSRNNQGFSL
jgi:hypothetical protein